MIYEIVYDTKHGHHIDTESMESPDDLHDYLECLSEEGATHIDFELIRDYFEEGDKCPRCGGPLYYPEVLNCSCHISAPCTACVMNKLECAECGYTPEGENK